jgi:hypothetical protein
MGKSAFMGNAGLYYIIEKIPMGYLNNGKLAQYDNSIQEGNPGYDICETFTLKSGKSILFPVLLSHLT